MADDETLTRNEQLVLEVLQRRKCPLTAYELLEHLRDEGLRGPPQIYRALQKLVGDSRVHKVESMKAFVACTHSHCDASNAFSICTVCGKVQEVGGSEVLNLLNNLSRQHDFMVEQSMIELRGVCSFCR